MFILIKQRLYFEYKRFNMMPRNITKTGCYQGEAKY